MNKRLNSVLFILGATVANIIVMILVFAILMVIFARFVAPQLSPMVNQIILLVLFIGSVVITYVLYHRLMRYLSQRFDLEAYFGPLFGKGGKGR